MPARSTAPCSALPGSRRLPIPTLLPAAYLPALDRVLLAHNASRFVPDVARREMDVVVVRPKEEAECKGGDSKEERDKRKWIF
uniref:Uncharacterized protein n=1 Tax=Fagus sylvatica TaxID=28930 RepID=A0A2N9EZQ7_FAGSY